MQGNAQPNWSDVENVKGRQVGEHRKVSYKVFLWNALRLLVRFVHLNTTHFFDLNGKHVIKDMIVTYSASLFFIEEPRSHVPLCLKMWRFDDEVDDGVDDGVYDTTTVEKRTQYIMDGWWFNRRFAPGVYLGVASIGGRTKTHIVINEFIAEPVIKDAISSGKEYALVMRKLPKEQWLDVLLERGVLDTLPNLMFLAQEVAQMHQMMEVSPLEVMGSISSLEEKLRANVALLEKITCIQDKQEKNKRVADILWRALEENKHYFEKRRAGNHIRHCHGDLKPSNLWLSLDRKQQPRQLLALDCVDFNRPEFCHIDTLSDVAMLAIYLEFSFMRRLGRKKGQKLIQYFLTTYLNCADEDYGQALPLLEYYMAEKAIVCAYTSYVYDNLQFAVVDRYLKLVFAHTEKLAAYRVPTASLKKNLLQRGPSAKELVVSRHTQRRPSTKELAAWQPA